MLFIPFLIAGFLLAYLIYVKTRQKEEAGKKQWVVTLVSILFGVTVLVSGALLVAILDPDVEIHEGVIEVSGLFKRNISIDDITEVGLQEWIPEPTGQINGFSLGQTLRGSFRTEEGIATMFVQKDRPPFVHIKTEERLFVINFRSSEDTVDLHDEILEKTGH